MKIYVTRHGETMRNQLDLVCGRTDAELSENGILQRTELGEKLVGKGIDLIIASPLTRAQQTAHIIAGHINAPVITDARIREIDLGKYEGGPRNNPNYYFDKRQFANKMGGGESLMMVARRVYPFLDEIKEKYKDKTVLVVCHGAMLRVLNSYFTEVTNEEFFLFNMSNCGLVVYDI